MKTKVFIILVLFLVPFMMSAKNNSDKTSEYGIDTTILFYVINPYETYAPNSKNITYDPISKTVSIIKVSNFRYVEERTGGIEIWSRHWNSYIFHKTTVIEDNEYGLPYQVSFSTANPGKRTDKDRLQHIVGFKLDHYVEEDSTYASDDISYLQIKEHSYNAPIYLEFPEDNNEDDSYKYNIGTVVYNNNMNAYMYNSASLDVNKNGQKGPAYFASLNLNSKEIEESKILPNFGEDKITYWGDDKTANTNSRNYIDTDQDGNLYLFAVNYLQPNHPINGVNPIDRMRTPAFMKSTDGGKTWSDWIKFPNQKLIDFANHNGQDPNKDFRPFGDTILLRSFGFAVRSVDKFTAVLPLEINTTTGAEVYFVDFSYENGEWQDLQVVHKLPMSYKLPSLVQSSDSVLIDSLVYGYGDNLEIELANVEGSEDLVLKFVQATHNIKLDSTYKVKSFDGEKAIYIDIDNLPNIGIYATSKSGEQWSGVYPEIDNEQRNECFSHIPDVVPDDHIYADHIYYIFPMTYGLAIGSIETYYRYGYDARMFDICKDWYKCIILNATDNVSVEENQNIDRSSLSFSIYPNPASKKAFIEYTGAHSITNIEIFDVLGNKVMAVVPEQIQAAGVRTASIDVTNLSNGTYYIHLTVGNETFTKTLNVVR